MKARITNDMRLCKSCQKLKAVTIKRMGGKERTHCRNCKKKL